MKQLRTYISEKLVLNKDTFKKNYNYFPTNSAELEDIILQCMNKRKDNDIIDLNDIDTSKITSMAYLFNNISDFLLDNNYKIDISKWNVSNVEFMHFMFYKCKNIDYIGDISGWDVSKVKNISYMFCDTHFNPGDLNKWGNKIHIRKNSNSMKSYTSVASARPSI